MAATNRPVWCLAFVVWNPNALGENSCWLSVYGSYFGCDKAKMAKLSALFGIFAA
jgi:hypothetical protein